MNVLSLFDGMSCGRIALERAGITVDNYYASEIDKFATIVSENNYPDIIRIGDITDWRNWDIDYSTIDLVLGGFPCQPWSGAGKMLGIRDERGMLFWDMVDIMSKVRKHNPDSQFLIENVKMKKEFENYITEHLGLALREIYKININSSLLSAQNRDRCYWTSWQCKQPCDMNVHLSDIIETKVDEKYNLSNKIINGFYNKSGMFKGKFNPIDPVYRTKSFCLTARYHKCGSTDPYILTGETNDNLYGITARRLTPVECERLQTIPEGYTSGVSDTQRYKMLGNGWTVDVITHLLLNMTNGETYEL